ncbi:protease B nonderepressible form [Aspergillus turcosus]|nr:protease B nonderepressible form [Aspergillus turcosus]
MRRRITFVQRPETPFDHDQAVLTSDALSITHLDGAREERATFSFDELPSEIWQVLKSSHELHIRWATERPYEIGAPFSSRISPGLHVYYTPGESGETGQGLCSLLKGVFDESLECDSLRYYSRLPSLQNLVTFIQHKFCDRSDEQCFRHAESILSADSVDVNYDSISHALTVSGYWSRSPGQGWTEQIKKHPAGTHQVEVGLLGVESAIEPEELKMEPTLFSFPSRHHPLPADATYTISFPAPTGLHPTLTISMPRASLKRPPAPPDATCALHTYLTLPSWIFGDKYQLSTTDPLFLSSHNLAALRAVSGETDLEAPDWFVSRWGSNWLLELATPRDSDNTPEEWNVTIPLHLRYLHPSESGYRSATVPWPIVFWACTAEDGTKMGINPFDRVNLGWEGLFGPRTMFYQLHPSPPEGKDWLVEELEVPVLRLREDSGFFRSKTIELGTVVVVALGLLWVLWKLGLVARTASTTTRTRTRTQNRKDKQGKAE